MLKETKIYKVGTLQDFGYPAVSLFAGINSRQLYLFLASDRNDRYGVIPVTQDELKSYIKGQTSLHTLEDNGMYEGIIENGEACLTEDSVPNCRNTMVLYDEFDEDLYYDEMSVFSFLYDFNHNHTLELTQ